MSTSQKLVWIDLEMTGLNPEYDVILEMATIITDDQLNVVEEGPVFVIKQSKEVLATMSAWARDQHTKTGLIKKVLDSNITLEQAEIRSLNLIKKYCKKKEGLLCGNSIWQDRNFLAKYMPRIIDHLYYRLIDVTSFKEAIKLWYPDYPEAEYRKNDRHRALDDIRESIEELKYLRKHFFIGR